MSITGIVIDIVIIAISLLIVFISRKRGAVKTVMSFVSGIASLLIAYVFTPSLSEWLQRNLFLDKLANSIMKTVASLAQSGKEAVYDVSKLMEDSRFLSVLERFGADPAETGKTIAAISDKSHGAVEKVSYAVAAPISKTVSDITAFAVIFILSLIVLKIVTLIISGVFELPVLRDIDKTVGTVFGVISAVFFILVFAMIINNTAEVLTTAAPSTFPENFPEKSLILHTLAKYNVISFITEKIGF